MVKHIIFLSSSYTQKERIAYHIPLMSEADLDKAKKVQMELKKKIAGKTQYSIYSVTTKDESWQSVVELDRFYADVRKVSELNDFVKLIIKDLQLEALDVAKYIISCTNCTHLKLQKLLYLCYQEYLHLAQKKMFRDKIYAYDLGPVIYSVYQAYKGTPGAITLATDRTIEIPYDQLAKKSRIIFADDGFRILFCIDKVIERYGNMTAAELVDLTHSPNSAWAKAYKKGQFNTEIPDDLIFESQC